MKKPLFKVSLETFHLILLLSLLTAESAAYVLVFVTLYCTYSWYHVLLTRSILITEVLSQVVARMLSYLSPSSQRPKTMKKEGISPLKSTHITKGSKT